MKPLLKWPGGKAKLAPLISEAFGKPCEGTYYEPFLGSGAVFLHRKAAGEILGSAVLSDSNPRLINFYCVVREAAHDLIDKLGAFPVENWRELYYNQRHFFNEPITVENSIIQAARMLWLNKACFNGLYRENKRGEFNVAPGSYKRLSLPSPGEILAVSRALRDARIQQMPFGETFSNPPWRRIGAPGDQVYCDPPYDAGFTGYTSEGFCWIDHQDLANECELAAFGGAKVVVSNSDTELTRRLYAEEDGWKIRELSVQRSISQSKERKKAKEILATIGGEQ